MKCSNIKLLLSDYIDQSMDGKTHSIIEQHLQECKTCQNEYASLKNIIGELGELPSIKAPADFLESIHAKMESGFDLNKLLRKLFVPFKIKIPLELLTAAATAVIIIFFVNVYQNEHQLPDLIITEKPESFTDQESPLDAFDTKEVKPQTQEKNLKKRKSVVQPQLNDKTRTIITDKPNDPPLKTRAPSSSPMLEQKKYSYRGNKVKEEMKSSKMDIPKYTAEPSLTTEKTAATPTTAEEQKEFGVTEMVAKKNLIKPIELTLILTPTSTSFSESTVTDMGKLDKDVSNAEPEPVIGSSQKEGETPRVPESGKEVLMEAGAAKGFLQPARAHIEEIINANSGKIISESTDEQTGQPISILAEIPASNFTSFYTQLIQIGRLKQLLSDIDIPKDKPLHVNILLIPQQ